MKPLLLLHGAIGALIQLEPLAEQLRPHYEVSTLNFAGHGGRPNADMPFSIELFANDVLDFMAQQQIDKLSIFGYSMGGYVAMYLAKHYPEKMEKVVTLGTKYHWDEPTATKEIQMLNPEKIEQKVPAFAEGLKKMHAPNDWKQVLNKTAEMMTNLGKDNTLKAADYLSITAPSLLMLGDRDKMVSLEETMEVYKALPNGQLCILPGTPHPIEQVDVELLGYMVKRFL